MFHIIKNGGVKYDKWGIYHDNKNLIFDSSVEAVRHWTEQGFNEHRPTPSLEDLQTISSKSMSTFSMNCCTGTLQKIKTERKEKFISFDTAAFLRQQIASLYFIPIKDLIKEDKVIVIEIAIPEGNIYARFDLKADRITFHTILEEAIQSAEPAIDCDDEDILLRLSQEDRIYSIVRKFKEDLDLAEPEQIEKREPKELEVAGNIVEEIRESFCTKNKLPAIFVKFIEPSSEKKPNSIRIERANPHNRTVMFCLLGNKEYAVYDENERKVLFFNSKKDAREYCRATLSKGVTFQ
jgi:hypothetical protein